MGRAERVLYRLLNAVARLLLRSPLQGLLGSRVMLLTVAGRESGRSYVVPLSYLRDGGDILCFTSGDWSAWWKNLRGGAPVTARVGGRRLAGSARAETDGDAVVRALGLFLAEFPRTAGRYGVGLDADGRPDPGTVERAVRGGRVVMVRVRTGTAGPP